MFPPHPWGRCWSATDTLLEVKHGGTRLRFFPTAVDTHSEETAFLSKIRVPARASVVRNGRSWDRGCGSQTALCSDAVGNLKELRTGAPILLCNQMPLETARSWEKGPKGP